MDYTPKLEPKHLFEKRATRDKAKLAAYNQILGQIHSRIYHTSQLAGNANYLVYTVPPFILGLPSIDLQDCIVYIVHMLRQSNFMVRFTYPNLLYISWKHYEAEYNRQQNPIVQAMTPAAQNTSKKGKEGKRGASPAVSFAPLYDRGGPGAAAPPRAALDYKPPDSFIQTITQPATKAGGPAAAPGQAPRTSADVLADLWKFA